MKILSLDPSSSVTGYAVTDYDSERVLEAGLCKPHKSRLPVRARVLSMLDDISKIIREHAPSVYLVECPLGKQYTRTPGKISGIPVWAFAAGTVFGWLEAKTDGRNVWPISNVLWTAGKSKNARVIRAGLLMPGYDAAHDKGADMADAICLAAWWIRQQKANDRLAAATRKGTR